MRKLKYQVGMIIKSKFYGDVEIIEYENCHNITVRFLNTGYVKIFKSSHLDCGLIKDNSVPSVMGVGIVGDKYKASLNGKLLQEYDVWTSMLTRCYGENWKSRNPTYKDCVASENFKRYEYFYEWCQKQVGFSCKGFELDKDLLVKGNKTYCEDLCVFLPKQINNALVGRGSKCKDRPIGVRFIPNKNMFVAQLSMYGKKKTLGYYATEALAFLAYKVAKETYIKELAEKWKDQIDNKAHKALINYEVGIDD